MSFIIHLIERYFPIVVKQGNVFQIHHFLSLAHIVWQTRIV